MGKLGFRKVIGEFETEMLIIFELGSIHKPLLLIKDGDLDKLNEELQVILKSPSK